jgi:hypothetical protein
MDSINKATSIDNYNIKQSWNSKVISPVVKLFKQVLGCEAKIVRCNYPLTAEKPEFTDKWTDLDGHVYALETCVTSDQKGANLYLLRTRLKTVSSERAKQRIQKRIDILEQEIASKKKFQKMGKPQVKKMLFSGAELSELRSYSSKERESVIEAKIDTFTKKLELGKLSTKKEKKAHRTLNFLVNIKEDPELIDQVVFSCKDRFISSNDFRELQGQRSFEEAEVGFNTGLVNARVQTQKDDKEYILSQYTRFGVISDMSNGLYSVEFLSQLKESPTEERIAAIDRKIADIKKLKPKEDRKAAACNNAIAHLHNLKSSNGDVILDDMLTARKERLQEQALAYLMLQIEQRPNVDKNAPLVLIDERLLDQTKFHINKGGWVHNEKVEFEDHRHALQMLNEKTIEIVPKGRGFVIDGDRIKMPEGSIPGLELGETVDIETYCFLCSPQGGQSNRGEMKAHNNSERQRLLMKHADLGKLPSMISLVESSSHDYDVASNLLAEITLHTRKNSNFRQSVGCLSAKDRTGVTVAAANKRLRQEGRARMDKHEDYLRHNGIASRIVKENTGSHVMKIAPKSLLRAELPGLSSNKQARYLLEQAISIMRGAAPSA